MIEPEKVTIATPEWQFRRSSPSHPHSHASPATTDVRLLELEIENSRLQRLVAELLLKNQHLRKDQE